MNPNSTVFVQRVSSLSRVARSGSSTIRVRQQSFHESRATQAIMMPALSPFMTEGTITKWFKKEGESFVAGDVLFQIESDVASLDIRAEMPGILGKILIPDGTPNVPVEHVLATVGRDAPELARVRPPPPPRLRPVPPPLSPITIRGPRSAYVEIPTPISATSFPGPRSARLPESETDLRRPSLHFDHPLSTREMIMDRHQNSCPSAGLCESRSAVGCEEGSVEIAGQDLRRKILQNFSKGSGDKQGSTEYFSGIL